MDTARIDSQAIVDELACSDAASDDGLYRYTFKNHAGRHAVWFRVIDNVIQTGIPDAVWHPVTDYEGQPLAAFNAARAAIDWPVNDSLVRICANEI